MQMKKNGNLTEHNVELCVQETTNRRRNIIFLERST